MSKIRVQKIAGFTLIELIVVIGIMTLITGLFLVNFNSLQGARNLKIANNQLISDIKRVQSYTLSSKNVPATGKPANYYYIKFSEKNPNGYIIGAIDSDNVPTEIESIRLPRNINVSSLSVKLPLEEDPIAVTCADTAFSLPFGRIFMDYEPVEKDKKEKDKDKDKDKGKDDKEKDGKEKDEGKENDCDIATVLNTSLDLTDNRNLLLSVSLFDASNPNSTPQIVNINGISQSVEVQVQIKK